MFKEIIKKINWGGKELTLKTGKVARQADGAVLVSMGDTIVLCTTVSAKKVKGDMTFFPLTVHYREMTYAAGKIPGGFMKREGKASDREVLVSRLIDRPIRPLFHPEFFNETQVICTVLSYDPKYPSDILAMIGASAAVAISGVPYLEIMAAAKVGYVDGAYVLNPSAEELASSKLDLVVAGTNSSVMMVESEAKELSEEVMLEAVEFGHKELQPVINLIEDLKKDAGKESWPTPDLGIKELTKALVKEFDGDIVKAYKITDKQERYAVLDSLFSKLEEKYLEEYGSLKLEIAFEELKSKVVRSKILSKKVRIDNRKPDEIRPIECEASILPRAHGSSLFTRGETQALVSVTLGSTQDEQMFENLDGDGRERFLLHYIFPPYSVGESTPFRAPGRREIGHGKLAWRAINPVLPSKEEFPYTMRIVSEITESNGSSSMATVCGASMSLMAAGAPLKSPVSGIAMGLIKEGKDYVVLSDIMGDEDHLGDMDFKVAGTNNGITALQMDIKVAGIDYEIMKIALSQAHAGRIHILEKMHAAITVHSESLSEYAPQIVTINVEKDKIREIIGQGGKVIKEICEVSGAKVDINDDGLVKISAVGKDKIEIALNKIRSIIYEPQIGDVMEGTVVKILDSGAFISIAGGKDGYLHISEISLERIDSVEDALSIGQEVKVKIIDFDRGKIKVSMKALLQNDGEVRKKPARKEEDLDSESNGNTSYDRPERSDSRSDSRGGDRDRGSFRDRGPRSDSRSDSRGGDRPRSSFDRDSRAPRFDSRSDSRGGDRDRGSFSRDRGPRSDSRTDSRSDSRGGDRGRSDSRGRGTDSRVGDSRGPSRGAGPRSGSSSRPERGSEVREKKFFS